MEQLRSQSLASPAERPCAAAGCGFFLLHVSLWCPPGCWLRGHPFIPPRTTLPPREEHLATMTITCHITAASHTHVQTKATTTWLWKCFYSVADASGWGAAGWAGFIQTVLSRNTKKCELYIMTASMLNIVAHGEVSPLVVMAANSLLNGKVAPTAIGWIAVCSPCAIFIFKCWIKEISISLSLFLLCALCYKLTTTMFTMSNIQLAFKFDAGATRHFLKRPSLIKKL